MYVVDLFGHVCVLCLRLLDAVHQATLAQLADTAHAAGVRLVLSTLACNGENLYNGAFRGRAALYSRAVEAVAAAKGAALAPMQARWVEYEKRHNTHVRNFTRTHMSARECRCCAHVCCADSDSHLFASLPLLYSAGCRVLYPDGGRCVL